jgi:hypothetical protein
VRQHADAHERGAVDSDGMYAGALQDAEAELAELRRDEQCRIALSAVALGASLVATAIFPPLVAPLLVGGLAIGVLGVLAFWRHWDLLDRLADDRDAYLIAEVLAYGAREARMDRRRDHAAMIRAWASCPDARAAELIDELADLADALEDDRLELDPASAMACRRFVSEPAVSPLFAGSSGEDLRSALNRLRAGFHPRAQSGGAAWRR